MKETSEAQCRDLSFLLDTTQGQRKLKALCSVCSCIEGCLEDAFKYMYLDDDGKPIAWHVQGGKTPEDQIKLFKLTFGGHLDLVCWLCERTTHPAHWSVEHNVCECCVIEQGMNDSPLEYTYG